MKKIFYLLTVIAAMFAITSCDTKGNSTTPTSPDDPKSGIEGTWVAVDTFYYNNSQWQQVVGRDIAMSDKETGYNAVYIFRQGKMSALAYSGILDGDDFLYVKGDDTSAPVGVAVDYWMEDGVFYNSLMPEGCKITFLDNKHMQMEGGYLLRKVDNLKQAPSQNPLCNTYWVECDENGEFVSAIRENYYFPMRFEDDGKHVTDVVIQYTDGIFVLEEGLSIHEGMVYIYAPNNNEIYLGTVNNLNGCHFYTGSGFPLQILQENGETYLIDAWVYKYGGVIERRFKKIEVTAAS